MVSTKRLMRGPVRQKPSKQRIAAGSNDFDTCDVTNAIEAAFHLNRLEIGRLAGDLALVAARFLDEHIERAPYHFAIERAPLPVEDGL
jgi:hypothetical protein